MKINFNTDWKFCRQNESTQSRITLPHDAMLMEKREATAPAGSAGAYFPGGIYEYEKEFEVPAEWKNKKLVIEFEGIYRKATVFFNQKEIGKICYGYTAAQMDLTETVQYGQKNVIRVVVENNELPNSRWYTGSGIYRPVWLYVLEKEHIEPYGIRIETISYEPAQIQVTVAHNGETVTTRIKEDEIVVAEQTGDQTTFTIPKAKLWSDETPYLYTCQVELKNQDHAVTDIREITFGIRKVEWSAKGLFINGKETLLRGGCVHHDNGILGACNYDESEERRVRILKENGFNAIRSAHNPCSRAMLEACDKYGVYMMDETWDMWYRHKNRYDYAADFMEHYREDIKAMVNKDYNHPSVIFYSIGNEVSEPASEKGIALAKEMTQYLHSLDSSRAVTAGLNLMIVANAAKGKQMYKEEGGLNQDAGKMSGMNSTMFNMITQAVGSGMNKSANGKKADLATTPVLDALDIAGYNYASGRYPMEGTKHPDRVIYGSETFPQDIGKNWEMVEKYPYLIGDFMWTAWDYLGEAGIGAWTCHNDAKSFDKPYPWLLAGAGVIDILGNPDGEAIYAKTVWGQNREIGIAVRPMNHPQEKLIKSSWRGTNAIPSWSWKNCEGNTAYVEVCSRAKTVELFLNGSSLGKKKTKLKKCVFKTKYVPGTIAAKGYDETGACIEDGLLQSARGELQVKLQPEKESIAAGELLYVNVSICGENDIVECNADEPLTLQVQGAELLGFGSAAPRTEENYLSGTFTTLYGRALAVIRAQKADNVTITVSGKVVKGGILSIPCHA